MLPLSWATATNFLLVLYLLALGKLAAGEYELALQCRHLGSGDWRLMQRAFSGQEETGSVRFVVADTSVGVTSRTFSSTRSPEWFHARRKVGVGAFEINLTREELAQLTATTLYSVSRQLSIWARKGVVSPRRLGLLVRNTDALVDLSDLE